MDFQSSGGADGAKGQWSPTLAEQFVVCQILMVTGVAMVLMINDELVIIVILFAIIELAAAYIMLQAWRHGRFLEVKEFQNDLFASALASGYAWFLLARQRDGRIIYRNTEFESRFPAVQPGNTVEEWLAAAGVLPEHARRIEESVGDEGMRMFSTVLEDASRRQHVVELFKEPIRWPAGFVLLRGREGPASGK